MWRSQATRQPRTQPGKRGERAAARSFASHHAERTSPFLSPPLSSHLDSLSNRLSTPTVSNFKVLMPFFNSYDNYLRNRRKVAEIVNNDLCVAIGRHGSLLTKLCQLYSTGDLQFHLFMWLLDCCSCSVLLTVYTHLMGTRRRNQEFKESVSISPTMTQDVSSMSGTVFQNSSNEMFKY